MCLAVPGKIISISDSTPDLRMAKVSFGGVVKDICIQWLPEAVAGDYVLAHVGTALSIVDQEDAEATLRDFEEMSQLLENEKSD
jgi:hydrogenase expression/formation protein HypC